MSVRKNEVSCPYCNQVLSTLEMGIIAHLKTHVRKGQLTMDEARQLARKMAD